MPIIATTHNAEPGVIYSLTGSQDLIVNAGIFISSEDNSTIYGNGTGQHIITIAGTVSGVSGSPSIELAGPGVGHKIDIRAGGLVSNFNTIVMELNCASPEVINAGTITGWIGIQRSGGSGTATIKNSGDIITESWSVYMTGEKAVLTNTGMIVSGDGFAYRGGSGIDVVKNKGVMLGHGMSGAINLWEGNDIYDGRGGKAVGRIDGGEDDDIFHPGRLREANIDGGDGFDTISFRKSGAVNVTIDGPCSGGFAQGDTYENMEKIIGSAKGNDTITGNEDEASLLIGLGGRDRLNAADRGDTLVGGMGKDTLDGTSATNYLYNKPGEGGDTLVSFIPAVFPDEFIFKASGFKGGLVAGDLPEGRFHIGTTRFAADRNDRFIFNEANDTLWFDRDGNRDGFAPVLIARLPADTDLTADLITII